MFIRNRLDKILNIIFLFITLIKGEIIRKHEIRASTGTEIPISKAPYTVYIPYVKCTGAIVHPFLVMTAASCFDKLRHIPKKDVDIIFGTADSSKRDNSLSSGVFAIHPKYEKMKDEDYTFDTAHMKVRHDVAFLELVKPIPIRAKFAEVLKLEEVSWPYGFDTYTKTCKLAGFGKNVKNVPYLHEFELVVQYGKRASMDEHCLWVNSTIPEDEAGTGDIGAPLVCNNKAVGIAAFEEILQLSIKNYKINAFAYIPKNLEFIEKALGYFKPTTEKIPISKAPYTVYITPGHCVGSIIHPNWIITAAHCFDSGETKVDIIFGTEDYTKRSNTVGVKSIVRHREYNTTVNDKRERIKYDLVLIELNQSIPIRKNFAEILQLEKKIWPPDEETIKKCKLAAFGDSVQNNSMLYELSVKALYGSKLCDCSAHSNIVCGVPPETHKIPYAESGATLVCDNVGIGIASAGLPLCNYQRDPYYEFLYIGSSLDFIEEITGINLHEENGKNKLQISGYMLIFSTFIRIINL